VADYFFVIGGVRVEEKENATRGGSAGGSGADGAVSPTPPPASSSAASGTKAPKRVQWQARILDRYPRTDWPDAECPENLESFAFPSLGGSSSAGGAGVLAPSNLCLAPEAHGFVLTEADGTRVFGVAFKFWEEMKEEQLLRVEEGVATAWGAKATPASPGASSPSSSFPNLPKGVYAPKVFVVVSHWPFYSCFERWLSSLYRSMYLLSPSPALVPFERALVNFIAETPLPPQGKFEVESRALMHPALGLQGLGTCPWEGNAIGTTSATSGATGAASSAPSLLLFSRPPPNKLPQRDYPLSALFRWLSLDNILSLYSAVLTERRVCSCRTRRSSCASRRRPSRTSVAPSFGDTFTSLSCPRA